MASNLSFCLYFKVADGALRHKRDYFTEDSKSQRASKSHYWFKNKSDFADWVNFAHWWGFIWKGLRLQPPQKASLGKQLNIIVLKTILPYLMHQLFSVPEITQQLKCHALFFFMKILISL